jgi:hypothetical protein
MDETEINWSGYISSRDISVKSVPFWHLKRKLSDVAVAARLIFKSFFCCMLIWEIAVNVKNRCEIYLH